MCFAHPSCSASAHWIDSCTNLSELGYLKYTRPPVPSLKGLDTLLFPFRQCGAPLADLTDDAWLDSEIRRRHSYQSFQHPDKIADAIRLITDVHIWDSVSIEMNMTAKDVKDRLSLIVDRRNKIAHEADQDPSTPGAQWPIDLPLVEDALVFMEGLAAALLSAVSK